MKIYNRVNASTGIRVEWWYDRTHKSWWFGLFDSDDMPISGPDLNFAHTKEEIEGMAAEALLEAVEERQGRCRFVKEVEKDVKAGDWVRSYDFQDRKDCYVEGIVLRVGHFAEFQDCAHVEIEATDRVIEGLSYKPTDAFFYPPANGTPTLFGEVTKFIEKVSRGGSLAHNNK